MSAPHLSGSPIEPGRELNVLVAEKVFGSVEAHAPVGDGMSRTGIFEGPTLGDCDAQIRERYKKHLLRGELWSAEYVGPDYSGDIAAAMTALDQLGGIVKITRYRAHSGDGFAWHVQIGERPACWAPSLPLAICLAALAALEAK